jgi:hypothetical protein
VNPRPGPGQTPSASDIEEAPAAASDLLSVGTGSAWGRECAWSDELYVMCGFQSGEVVLTPPLMLSYEGPT